MSQRNGNDGPGAMGSRLDVCHVQWLETPRPRGPHPLASVVREWWKVRAAKAVSN